MKKLILVVLFLLTLSVAYAQSTELVITETDGLKYTFECRTSGFEAETYDWDIGFGGEFVAYDVTYDTLTHTFSEPGEQRAACAAWDQDTMTDREHEIYFDVEQMPVEEFDIEEVSFRGCSEVWIVFEEFHGPVDAIIETSEEDVHVTIYEGDLTKIPGQYGQLPVFKWEVHAHYGPDAKILGVDIDGEEYVNENNCATVPRNDPPVQPPEEVDWEVMCNGDGSLYVENKNPVEVKVMLTGPDYEEDVSVDDAYTFQELQDGAYVIETFVGEKSIGQEDVVVDCEEEPPIEPPIEMELDLIVVHQEDLSIGLACEATGFEPESYDWNFGDGETAYDVEDALMTHVYEPGCYVASCSAWDQETGDVLFAWQMLDMMGFIC